MNSIQDISLIFISILLEATPFVLLGVILSSCISIFVRDDFFAKIIPKNPVMGSVVGVLLGFFIPACDCGVIPVSRRLIKKGVPINVAISFMLSSPIINPVVLLATIYAFGSIQPSIIVFRVIFGVIIAIAVGVLLAMGAKKEDVLKEENDKSCCSSCHCSHHHEEKPRNTKLFLFKKIIYDSSEEFIDVMKYLVIGALIASSAQIFIPLSSIESLSGNSYLSSFILMSFAYLISLCSTSDAFVAKSFVGQFSYGAILGFLILGPMIDIKNTLVLSKYYKKGFVFRLILFVFVFTFIVSAIAIF